MHGGNFQLVLAKSCLSAIREYTRCQKCWCRGVFHPVSRYLPRKLRDGHSQQESALLFHRIEGHEKALFLIGPAMTPWRAFRSLCLYSAPRCLFPVPIQENRSNTSAFLITWLKFFNDKESLISLRRTPRDTPLCSLAMPPHQDPVVGLGKTGYPQPFHIFPQPRWISIRIFRFRASAS